MACKYNVRPAYCFPNYREMIKVVAFSSIKSQESKKVFFILAHFFMLSKKVNIEHKKIEESGADII